MSNYKNTKTRRCSCSYLLMIHSRFVFLANSHTTLVLLGPWLEIEKNIFFFKFQEHADVEEGCTAIKTILVFFFTYILFECTIYSHTSVHHKYRLYLYQRARNVHVWTIEKYIESGRKIHQIPFVQFKKNICIF